MKIFQANGQGLASKNTGLPLSNIIKSDNLFFCIWSSPYDPRRGYFGGLYVSEVNVKTDIQRESLLAVSVEIESGESFAVYSRDFRRNVKKGEIVKKVFTLSELRSVK